MPSQAPSRNSDLCTVDAKLSQGHCDHGDGVCKCRYVLKRGSYAAARVDISSLDKPDLQEMKITVACANKGTA